MTIIRRSRGRKARCPMCGGSNTHRKGTRRTATLGNRPLRYCTDCRRKFTLHRQQRVSARAETPEVLQTLHPELVRVEEAAAPRSSERPFAYADSGPAQGLSSLSP